MANRALMITGFEPFHRETINPSWEAVAALPETIGPWKLEKLRLPVVFGQAAELVLAHTEKIHPDVILSVGQAGGRDAITPEVIAINLQNASIPDNAGNQPHHLPIHPEGHDGYFATVPVRRMVDAAQEKGILCKLSYSAGTYVCNDVFYRLLYHHRGSGVQVGFIHVPFLPQQAKVGQPSMALEEMVRGLDAVISAL